MLELYGHPFSSYTWKAQIALHALDADYTFRMVDPDHVDNAAFVQQAHPAGKFPVLRDGDTTVIEATTIIEYLAATVAGGDTLIPRDARAAVTVRMLDRVFDNYVMGHMQHSVNAYLIDPENPNRDALDIAQTGLRRAYRWLEDWLEHNSFPAHVSLVTCSAAPSLFYADWVERIPDDCPHLTRLRAELLALPPVARCVDAARPYRQFFPLGAPDRD